MMISANLVVSLKAEIFRVEVACPFDGYECFRHLCCFSRFYYPFRCPRFVEVHNGAFTPKSRRVDLNFRVKRRERC